MKERYINGFKLITSIMKRQILVIGLYLLLTSFYVAASTLQIDKNNGTPLGDGNWEYRFILNPTEDTEIFIPPSLSLISSNTEPAHFERITDSYLWGFIKVDKGTKLIFGQSAEGKQVVLIYGPTQSFISTQTFSIF